MTRDIRKLAGGLLAIALVLTMGLGALAAKAPAKQAIIETPGVLLAQSLGLEDGTEVIGLSNGVDEKGRTLTFVLYADATPVFASEGTSPIYTEKIGIACISATGKIVKQDGIIEGGYTPSMVNVGLDSSGDLGVYLLISAPTGGSGGTSTFKLMRYYQGAWSELLGEEFALPIEGYLNNYFRGTIRIPDAKINFPYALSAGEKETLIAAGNYESDGKLNKRDDAYFWTDGFVSITPMIAGEDMVLIAQETVFAGYHANGIARINGTYRLNEKGTALELQRASVVNLEDKVLASTK